jgi:endogenous inhibitor of DNA gyrase (YacG/DUF329 family)
MSEPPKPEKVELCVFCRRHPADPAWRPFCSERCRMQDLARWADQSYRVPAEAADNAEKVTDPDG